MLLLAFIASDPAWTDFSGWFAKEGIPGAPDDVVKAYAAKLTQGGTPRSEVDSRVAEIKTYLRDHPREAWTLHFNRIYTWTGAPFSREPSEFVRKIAATRTPGRALDIAMGQGRNAIWLARNGWTVAGYDLSDEALRQAQAGANAAGVKLDARLSTHEEFNLGSAQWDLIVMCFAFTDLHDAAYMKRVHDALKPGGLLVVEGFGGPQPERNRMLGGFLDYRVLVFEDLPGISDWGKTKMPLLKMALERVD